MKWYWVILIIIVLITGLALYNRLYHKNITPPKAVVDGLNGNFYNVIDRIINGDNDNNK